MLAHHPSKKLPSLFSLYTRVHVVSSDLDSACPKAFQALSTCLHPTNYCIFLSFSLSKQKMTCRLDRLILWGQLLYPRREVNPSQPIRVKKPIWSDSGGIRNNLFPSRRFSSVGCIIRFVLIRSESCSVIVFLLILKTQEADSIIRWLWDILWVKSDWIVSWKVIGEVLLATSAMTKAGFWARKNELLRTFTSRFFVSLVSFLCLFFLLITSVWFERYCRKVMEKEIKKNLNHRFCVSKSLRI